MTAGVRHALYADHDVGGGREGLGTVECSGGLDFYDPVHKELEQDLHQDKGTSSIRKQPSVVPGDGCCVMLV